ncbi:transposable element Tcb1 transposase [Diachasmimorpha longicaudata]|uniref:transposable element Tcb1 transposase n=1 Tax=Diachasmimorpha longicaudata TaxID=58733 RepID=UPI0030B8EDAE
MTAHQLKLEVEQRYSKVVSDDTIRRILKKAGYDSRVARKKPYISEINRQKRMDFANEYVSKPPEFWNSIIFTDESKFCIFGIKGKKLVWRKTGKAYEKENMVPSVKHGGSGVMVWGCMAANGVGKLTFIDSIMDQRLYIQILKDNLLQSVRQLGMEQDFRFQQDNDPKHTAQNVKLWLLYNVKNQLRTPPQSPDLNPIEHLWDLLERRIRKHAITSKKMLKDIIMQEWGKIAPEDTAKLVDSMPRRLIEVLKRKGYPTRY